MINKNELFIIIYEKMPTLTLKKGFNMKKIIPIMTMLGTSALIVGISLSPTQEKKENYVSNINTFQNEFSKYASVNDAKMTKSALNKYTLSLEENLDDIINQDITNVSENESNNEIAPITETPNDDISTENSSEFTENETDVIDEDLIDDNVSKVEIEQISTLYSLSSDIENSCDDFCELKEEISQAIIETQNLISKVQQKEIELTSEQRMFITEQAQQLKNLGRQLSNITTELAFNLSDLNTIMTANDHNIDNLSLKYLVVLDNLVNGNEMLQSGLSSLNLINQMFNMNTKNIPSNNQGRILYGFKQNDNPPVIKDYYIDENGELIDNNNNENSNTNEDAEKNLETVSEDPKKTNIDTYKNTNLNTNLDTYNNSNLPRNIDSFFNTALLDNEFMYGNNEFMYGNGMQGVNNFYGPNPYYPAGYGNYANHSINSIQNNNNTQHIEENNNNENETRQSKKEKKRFKLKKNIDTFKDENEPSIKTKLGNIKSSISGFFSKFKQSDLNDKIENPISRYNAKNE